MEHDNPSFVGGTQEQAPNKDLLRLDKDYFDSVFHQNNHTNPQEFSISRLFQGTAPKKPNISQAGLMGELGLLQKLQAFTPMFMQSTEELMNDPAKAEAARVEIVRKKPEAELDPEVEKKKARKKKKKAKQLGDVMGAKLSKDGKVLEMV